MLRKALLYIAKGSTSAICQTPLLWMPEIPMSLLLSCYFSFIKFKELTKKTPQIYTF
jgi:hypothetical protein